MIATREWAKDLLAKVLKKKINNYSLEEQKVGTWIDGKPIYERTFSLGNNIKVSSDNTTTNISIENICSIVDSKIVICSESLSKIGFVSVNTWIANNTFIAFAGFGTFNAASDRFVYLTIQYTKTTD